MFVPVLRVQKNSFMSDVKTLDLGTQVPLNNGRNSGWDTKKISPSCFHYVSLFSLN